MADQTLCFLDLTEMAALVARREISPVDLVTAHLARCARLSGTLNAFITLTPDRAMAQARAAEREIVRGRCRGPLHGIPIAHKDVCETAGIRTTYGASAAFEALPARDATVVRRLRAAGAIALGKTNLDEFAAAALSDNPWHGAVRNPWDLDRSAGGSSGGSAAAVAAFLCPGATGTDTGGSIRNPAACTGIVGFKPTNASLPMGGVLALAPSLDTVGPLARTVADAAILFRAMTAAPSPFSTVPAAPASLRGLRIGRCPDLHPAAVDRRVLAAIDAAADVLHGLGAELAVVAFPHLAELREAGERLFYAEAFAVHRARLSARPEAFGAELRAMLHQGAAISAGDYDDARRTRLRLRRAFGRAMRGVDALVLPVTSTTAPSRDGRCRINGRPADFRTGSVWLRMPVNLLGAPALALPTGYADGLPTAMQMVAAPGREEVLFRLGRAYEAATPALRRRWPACAA